MVGVVGVLGREGWGGGCWVVGWVVGAVGVLGIEG